MLIGLEIRDQLRGRVGGRGQDFPQLIKLHAKGAAEQIGSPFDVSGRPTASHPVPLWISACGQPVVNRRYIQGR